MSNKERSSSDMSSKTTSKPQHDPLVLLGIALYTHGCMSRGPSYLLSGSGLVPLALPFAKRKVDYSIAINMIPLGVLFVLEHVTIMSGMDNIHNAVHSLSHYAIHKTVSDLYVKHVL
eukprot:CAMPEP_0197236240 /NCGR_PEP_ID=MMETSP1429-20130617/3423_1 /TAXON_ID=49237 /ORGANISM="Chaetoceros  sp., Strain UNC1202" /LENGTH=116 /DNA_ID=CAMNT_0042694995 /DNA_START=219 /DNA_END=569 /DNA_ORIENTATION=-